MSDHPKTEFDESLRSLVHFASSSFGPLGSIKLVVSGSKQINASRRCREMAAEMFAKPEEQGCAATIVKAAMSNLPDGSHSLLKIASAGLQKVSSEAHGCGMQSLNGGQLVHAVCAIKAWFLYEFLPEAAHSIAVAVPSNCTDPSAAQASLCVLYSMLSCSMDRPSAKHLSGLLLDLIASNAPKHMPPMPGLIQSAQHLQKCPPIMKIPGRSVLSSSFLGGMVIHGTFASVHMEQSLSNIRFIASNSSLEANTQQSTNGSISVTSASTYQELLQQSQQQILRKLEVLRSAHQEGVTLVITSEKVSEQCSFIALQLGISIIQLVPKDELQRLCFAAAINLWSFCGDQHALQRCVGFATSVEHSPLETTQRSFVVRLPEQASQVGTLILCAPSEWQCQQLSKMLLDGLSIIAEYLTGNEETAYLLPGGAALEATLASQLGVMSNALREGGVPPCIRHLIHGQFSVQVFAQAMDVFAAAARAVIQALAHTGAQSAQVQAAGTAPLSVALLVSELLNTCKECPAGGWGLVAPLAARLRCNRSTCCHHTLTKRQGMVSLLIGKPSLFGVLEPLPLRLEVWQRAVESMLQIIRISGVVPACCRILPTRMLVVGSSKQRGVRRGGYKHAADGGSSNEDSEDSD